MGTRSKGRKRAVAVARAGSTRRRRPARSAPRRRPDWRDLPDEELLDQRLCDLGLAIEGTPLESRLAQLDAELERAGLRFRPHAWLSSDWFTPDGATGFAIPFFLAHPRLVALERKAMLEVEGGTAAECMRLLRHEAAHALDNAHGLHRRRAWRRVFGRFSEPYRRSYAPDPRSRAHVLNLGHWYAQSHPAEDWAETFAVWLDPGSRWRERYAGWPRALAKLEFVEDSMGAIADGLPQLRTRQRVEPVSRLRTTLRALYDRKRALYDDERTPGLDRKLSALFAPQSLRRPQGRAASFLRANRRTLVERVAHATGQHRYLIDHVLGEMIQRSRALRLRRIRPEQDTLLDAALLASSLTTRFLLVGHPRYHR